MQLPCSIAVVLSCSWVCSCAFATAAEPGAVSSGASYEPSGLIALAMPAQSDPAVPATKAPLSAEALEALVASIALYPDALVSQILMASTYPIEVVEADRWTKANSSLTGDALAKALEAETWDPSVKSLVEFPDVLAMMSDQLDWTTKLGDAFIAQQKDVMAAIQSLRAKAKQAGSLQSTEQQKVEVQQAGATQTIVIQSTSPEVIYVPRYDPVVVYGTWPYPSYPPYAYYPPGYVAGSNLVSFSAGLALGAAWGYAWGGCNWRGGDVDIDINRNANFNTNINRTQINNNLSAQGISNGKGQWQHDSTHRRGAAYSDNATAQRYGRGTDAQAAQARDQFRGRADQGRQDLARGEADQFRGQGGGANRDGGGAANRGGGAGGAAGAADRGAANRGGGGAGDRSGAGGSAGADRSRGGGGSAVSGSNRSGSSTRAASSRGSSSRASSGGSRSGGSRSGGGASRGGGGGGRGGGRR